MSRAEAAHPLAATEQAARRATARAQPWADHVAQAGYLAKGAVFLLVGGLALTAAMGLGGRATDPSGALATVAGTSAGRLALAIMALGLLSHAAFRAMLVLVGEPYADHGPWRSALRRVTNAGSAVIYAGLAVTAAALAAGWRAMAHADKDAQTREGARQLLAQPYGRPLLLAVAGVIIVVAVVEVVRAFGPNNVRKRLRVEEMTERECRLMSALGRLAFLARAVVLGSVGAFLVRAGLDGSPRQARGPAGALRALGQQPHGDILLALVAVGLIAFGVYGLFEARWRRLLGR